MTRVTGVPATMLDEAAERFRLLSDPTRLRLLNELDLADEICVGEIADRAGVGLSNTSKHLHQLELDFVLRAVGLSSAQTATK